MKAWVENFVTNSSMYRQRSDITDLASYIEISEFQSYVYPAANSDDNSMCHELFNTVRQNQVLAHTVICVLTFQVIHTMFNVVFPFVLQELVQGKRLLLLCNLEEGGGRTMQVKSIFDAARITASCFLFPLYGVLSDRYGRKVVLYFLIIASLVEGTLY